MSIGFCQEMLVAVVERAQNGTLPVLLPECDR